MSPTSPNYFIVGAPKTGTTALAAYLADHPQVFVSNPKEPFFWDSDHPKSKPLHGMTSLDAYLRLFQAANPTQHLAIGEGSTTYMQSRVAIKNLMQFNPSARVIAMLRNPVQVAYAMHGELVRHFLEDELDFEKSWALQAARRAGRQLPPKCRMDHQLQYQDVATFAPQIERLLKYVPEEQRKIIVFDDFAAETGRCYRETVEFLGLSDDGRTEFPRIHAAKVFRSQWVGRMYHDPPRLLEKPVAAFRQWFTGGRRGAVKHMMGSLASKPKPRPPLRPEFEAYLRDVFRTDIERVSELLDRDLTSWVSRRELVSAC